MRIYLAAPLALVNDAKFASRHMVSRGHEVVSTWHEFVFRGDKDPLNPVARREILELNIRELEKAQFVVAIMTYGVPRATYSEIGYALALSIPVVWIGDGNVNIFNAHPLSTTVPFSGMASSLDEVCRFIEDGRFAASVAP